MDWGKVASIFFILMALTSNASFVYGGDSYNLVITVAMSLIATLLKLGSRKTLGAELMATSLVADLHLIPALVAFFGFGEVTMAKGLAIGALVANVISVALITIDTILDTIKEENAIY
ncbi:MAG: DUF6394 family protein [Nitrospirota bacterium]|nr:DUF6394 family protein [Nitrospirota bacterium]